MGIFDRKTVTQELNLKSPLDSIDEILATPLRHVETPSRKQDIKELDSLNRNLRKHIDEQKKQMDFKPSNKGSFIENYNDENPDSPVKTTGDGSTPEFGSTENTNTDTPSSKTSSFKRSEIPLLSRSTVLGIGSRLKENVFGQNLVIEEIEDGLVVNTVNLNINEDKPVGCYLFAGPSGVGKTELCVQLAKQLDVPILVVNMGEHALEQDVTKLIGVASGYVGYANGGLLTNFVSENPRCVIVFDELEKAHISINKILLSIMDKGVCRDNKNREVFFNETLFIATTNLGADAEYFTELTDEQKFDYRMGIIKDKLAPEIINRYDSIFQFKALTPEIYGNIVRKFAKQLSDNSEKRNGFEIVASDNLISFATKHSYDPAMGGRPARRFIEKIVLKPLAYKLLDEEINARILEQKSVILDIEKDKIVFKLGEEIIGTLDNTMDLVNQYSKGKFTNEENKEISPEDIPEQKIVPELDVSLEKEAPKPASKRTKVKKENT